MQQRGSRTSSSTGSYPTASSIGAALLMLRLLILPGSLNAISSRASAVGRSHYASPDGPTTEKSGRDRRRASRSRTPVSSLPPVMNGIYGPTYSASSVPEGPMRSLESRLRQRLGLIGSTECSLIWKAATTPAGRSYSRLVPSTPRTVEIVSTSPHATHTHTHTIELSCWITATTRDWKDSPGMSVTRPDGRSRVDQLPRQVTAAMWATLTSSRNSNAGSLQSALKEAERLHPKGRYTLMTQIAVSLQPTMTASENKYRLQGNSQQSKSLAAISILTARGAAQLSSSDTTEKLGGLNPLFACWLMGFPAAWDACAPTATPSSRNSRRK